MSGARVFRLGTQPACYLKIACKEGGQILRNEIARTRWLANQGINVARLVRSHDGADCVAIQTEALPGQAADRSGLPEAKLLSAIGTAVAELHALSPAACPFDESLQVRHRRAREAIAKGEIDPSHFASRNRTTAPARLFSRLLVEPPPEELVVVHGDLTLTNMIVGSDGTVGFVDCGFAGRADRYLDLAVIAAEIRERSVAGRSQLSPMHMGSSDGIRKRKTTTPIYMNCSRWVALQGMSCRPRAEDAEFYYTMGMDLELDVAMRNTTRAVGG